MASGIINSLTSHSQSKSIRNASLPKRTMAEWGNALPTRKQAPYEDVHFDASLKPRAHKMRGKVFSILSLWFQSNQHVTIETSSESKILYLNVRMWVFFPELQVSNLFQLTFEVSILLEPSLTMAMFMYKVSHVAEIRVFWGSFWGIGAN